MLRNTKNGAKKKYICADKTNEEHMPKLTIKQLLASENYTNKEINLKGWVRSFRANRFIALNDGSSIQKTFKLYWIMKTLPLKS